jgi:hypothetical protein
MRGLPSRETKPEMANRLWALDSASSISRIAASVGAPVTGAATRNTPIAARNTIADAPSMKPIFPASRIGAPVCAGRKFAFRLRRQGYHIF